MSFSEEDFVGVHPVSAIYVDIPNVINKGVGAGRRQVSWPALARAIIDNKDLAGTDLAFVGAYTPHKEDARYAAGALGRTFRTQYGIFASPETRDAKDIDSLIISDMWQSVVQHEQHSMRYGQLFLPLQVRHVIVSGDAGYLRACRALTTTYGSDHLEYELYVYSWREHLSHELKEAANVVRFLDDIPHFESASRINSTN